ncbi:MAG TPA: diguanylate cyclase, partial [Pyrinomonadaceae bacterium]|nr:diguanylate cyclase [Pyrinomonadaceae bacterium]
MSAELIELGLSRANRTTDVRPALAAVIERLGLLVAELPVEADQLKTADFRAQLESHQARVITAPSNEAAQSTLMSCLELCQDYFQRAGKYILERETELNEVIKVLREAVAELAGEANNFHGNLVSTTERFSQMAKLEDLRHIRNAIAQEVGELKKIVAEKQKKDQASYSRLTKRIDGLQSKLNKAKEEATFDPLTRIVNRGGFDAAVKRWIAEHKESDAPFVLAMLDIDDFKMINDTHGHQIGDRVLVCAAEWLSSNIRAEDLAT